MCTSIKTSVFKYLMGCITQLIFLHLFQSSYVLFSRSPLSTIKINLFLHVDPKYLYFVNHTSINLEKYNILSLKTLKLCLIILN